MKVDLYRGGELVARGQAALNIRLFADLPVPKQKIERHAVLTPEMFENKRFDVTNLTAPTLSDLADIEDQRAKHALYPERMVSLSKLEPVPAVELGEPVAIVASAAGLEVRADGRALENGAIGELIKVKNTSSNAIVTAKVIDEAVVEVPL
jgi:flagella basal body P-ring formation protein FlgA